jgi:general secretion pathway protein A
MALTARRRSPDPSAAFRGTVDPAQLWRVGQYDLALTALRAGVLGGVRILVLTGEPGTGKTVLTRALAWDLRPAGVVTGRLLYPMLDGIDLLRGIAQAFGLSTEFDTEESFIAAIDGFAAEMRARGRRLLLVIDDAQSLPLPSLAAVARLAGGGGEHTAPLAVLLAGHTRLTEFLRTVGVEAGVAWQLRPLNRTEAADYVAHRMRVAGALAGLLPADAIEAICRESGGIPQAINRACEEAIAERHGRQAALESDPGEEWPGEVSRRRRGIGRGWRWALAVVGVIAGVVVVLAVAPQRRPASVPTVTTPAPSVPSVAVDPPPETPFTPPPRGSMAPGRPAASGRAERAAPSSLFDDVRAVERSRAVAPAVPSPVARPPAPVPEPRPEPSPPVRALPQPSPVPAPGEGVGGVRPQPAPAAPPAALETRCARPPGASYRRRRVLPRPLRGASRPRLPQCRIPRWPPRGGSRPRRRETPRWRRAGASRRRPPRRDRHRRRPHDRNR